MAVYRQRELITRKWYDADLSAIEQAVPKGAAKGERYPAQAMAHLDSEKRG